MYCIQPLDVAQINILENSLSYGGITQVYMMVEESPAKDCPYELCFSEISLIKSGRTEISYTKVSSAKVGFDEIRYPEISPEKGSIMKLGPVEIGTK